MNITLDATGIIAIIGALVTGILSVLGAIGYNTHVTRRGQAESRVRSEEIHVLVNRRLLTALRLVVLTTKRLWEQSGSPADRATYEEALAELQAAEDAANTRTIAVPTAPPA